MGIPRLRVLPSLLPKQVELESDGTNVRWRYVGEDWVNIVSIADISSSVTIGSVTTLPPGSPATVTNSGTAQAVILNFALPAGADGEDGADGDGTVDSVNGQSGNVVLAAGDVGALPDSYLDTDGTAAANSDAKIMSQKATRTFVAAAVDALKDGVAAGFDTLAEIAAAIGTITANGWVTTVRIAANAVTLGKLAQVSTATFLGRTTASTGDVESLTGAQATALLSVMGGDAGAGGTKGLAPAPAPGDAAAGKYLKASGAYDVPPGGIAVYDSQQPTVDVGSIVTTGLANCRSVSIQFALTIISGSHSAVQARASGGTWRDLIADIDTTADSTSSIYGTLTIDNFGLATGKPFTGHSSISASVLDNSNALNSADTPDVVQGYSSYAEIWDEVRIVTSGGTGTSIEGSTSDQRGRWVVKGLA